MQRLIHALDASGHFRVRSGELSIAVLDGPGISAVHAEFLADPTPTDVITFDGDLQFGSAGEICVCADVAREYAQANDLDFATEFALYVAHGYLHLAGFDDTTAPARRKMREVEKVALAVLSAADAIPQIQWKSGRRPNDRKTRASRKL